MTEPVWLDPRAVRIIHDEMLAAHGGGSGIRSENLLDSALARPKNAFAYGESDLFQLAALYAAGVAKNHAFVDGNKRTAFVSAILFLELNAMRFTASEDDVVRMTVALAASEVDVDAYAAWLRAWTSRPAG